MLVERGEFFFLPEILVKSPYFPGNAPCRRRARRRHRFQHGERARRVVVGFEEARVAHFQLHVVGPELQQLLHLGPRQVILAAFHIKADERLAQGHGRGLAFDTSFKLRNQLTLPARQAISIPQHLQAVEPQRLEGHPIHRVVQIASLASNAPLLFPGFPGIGDSLVVFSRLAMG